MHPTTAFAAHDGLWAGLSLHPRGGLPFSLYTSPAGQDLARDCHISKGSPNLTSYTYRLPE